MIQHRSILGKGFTENADPGFKQTEKITCFNGFFGKREYYFFHFEKTEASYSHLVSLVKF
jgi:hypothetical protein